MTLDKRQINSAQWLAASLEASDISDWNYGYTCHIPADKVTWQNTSKGGGWEAHNKYSAAARHILALGLVPGRKGEI